MRNNLTSRLLIVIAIAYAPALALTLLVGALGFQLASQARNANFELQASAAIDAERATFQQIRQTLRLTASRSLAEIARTGDCSETFDALADEHVWSTRGMIFNAEGHAVCGASRPIYSGDARFWPRVVEDRHFTIGDVFVGRMSGKRIIRVYAAMPGEDENLFSIGVGLDFAYFAGLSAPQPGEPTFAMLDAEGELLAYGDAIGEEALSQATWLPADRGALLTYGDRFVEARSPNGETLKLFTTEVVPDELWAVTPAPQLSLSNAVASKEGQIVLLPLLGLLLGAAAVWWSVRRLITTHLDRLAETARAIGAGREIERLSAPGAPPEEFELLERTLVEMGLSLRDRNERLTDALEAQKRLLLEVHHRVKNNFQTISSLVSLESRRVRDPDAKSSMKYIQERLNSLSMVHRNLYSSSDMDRVDLARLIVDLSALTNDTLADDPLSTAPALDLDAVEIGNGLATPVALFLTEAITNAFKHGAPKDPKLRISLKAGDGAFTLTIRNAVAPFAKSVDEPNGLGEDLMRGFAEQIDGEYLRGCEGEDYWVLLTASTQSEQWPFSIAEASDPTMAAA